jgi:hypothetical protein
MPALLAVTAAVVAVHAVVIHRPARQLLIHQLVDGVDNGILGVHHGLPSLWWW